MIDVVVAGVDGVYIGSGCGDVGGDGGVTSHTTATQPYYGNCQSDTI